MLAFVFAALIALDAPPAPAPPAPAAQPNAPLREIVYKFADNEMQQYSSDQNLGDTLGGAPQSSTGTEGYSGTMTVDVLQVDPSTGFIKVEARDQTTAQNNTKQSDAVFVIHPDGTLGIVSGLYDTDMTVILPYLGTQYFGAHDPLQQGMQWVDQSTFDKGQPDEMQLEITSTVTGVDGNDVSVRSATKAVHGVHNGSLDVETSLVYNAAKLVPLTLDVVTIRRASGVTASGETTLHTHFDRVSDTLDPTK